MRIAIAGGGIAGTAAALALARAGHEVVVAERDPAPMGGPQEAFLRARPGAPQYHQPHVLLARACNELLSHAPDVYAHLLALGATEIEESHPDAAPDDELRALGVRRPLLEWALHRALADEPGATVHFGRTVRGAVVDETSGVVHGLRTGGATIAADLTIDALGRTSPLPGLLRALGVRTGGVPAPGVLVAPTGLSVEDADWGVSSGMAYYSRYYRLHGTNPLRPGHQVAAAVVDLGYARATLFWAEDRHVGLVLAVPAADGDLKAIRDEAAFEAVVAGVGPLADRIGPGAAVPVSPVRAMGSLRTSWRDPAAAADRLPARHILTIGDALCHTNPLYGWGVSLAFAQAFALPGILAAHPGDLVAAQAEHARTARPPAVDRFRAGLALDRALTLGWRGEQIDWRADVELFRMRGLGLAAATDAQIHQRLARWRGCLDSSASIDGDAALLDRARSLAERAPAPAPVPARAELLGRIAAAVG
ncbi:MAG: FAD-dependent oxidoreductase [Hamadaea sp.]|nr:FAD-dependent oxidoreductase [Hamadaea sp.]